MIKKMLAVLKSGIFTKKDLPANEELHDLKNKLAEASAEAVVSAKQYTKTMKRFRRDDVIYQIGVFTGNVKRN